jgi:twitching motility two-component system response regulator PilH
MMKKILIVDDDPDVILFIATILKDHGYKALDAKNGQEGLRMVQSENPDMVLLDLMMPQKSGIALLSEMKKDERLKKIPVIMVTGVAGETGIDLESFLKRGTAKGEGDIPLTPEGYIEKPVDPEKLITLIKEFLGE